MAEACALLLGIDMAQQKLANRAYPLALLKVRTDCQDLVCQIWNRHYTHRDRAYMDILARIRERLDTDKSLSLKWIPREENLADELARRAARRCKLIMKTEMKRTRRAR